MHVTNEKDYAYSSYFALFFLPSIKQTFGLHLIPTYWCRVAKFFYQL